MKKCQRTLDNWCADGVMPQPAILGGSRYWHPDIFYGWLDTTLHGQVWDSELADQAVPGAYRPFEPLTREDVAAMLEKSIRTLENWYGGGLMPSPVLIGGTYYWHPDIVNDWFDARLKGRSCSPDPDVASTGAALIPVPVPADNALRVTKSSARAKLPANGAGKPGRLRGRAKAAAMLKEMNSP